MGTTYVDLVLDNGKLIRVECPAKHEEELHDSLDECRARGDWWSPNRFDGCRAEYLGHLLDCVDMQRVVGML